MLRNADYTDRELLHVVDDVTAGDGYADTYEIAERLGFTGNGSEQTGRHAVATRMAWMVRYGYCTRDRDQPGRYKLTKDGRALMSGELDHSMEETLAAMDPGTRVMVLRTIAKPTFNGAQVAQHMLRREYLHHYENRKRPRKR